MTKDELKTLNDLDLDSAVIQNLSDGKIDGDIVEDIRAILKQEAIKHWKDIASSLPSLGVTYTQTQYWIEQFFNITEEDLKDG